MAGLSKDCNCGSAESHGGAISEGIGLENGALLVVPGKGFWGGFNALQPAKFHRLMVTTMKNSPRICEPPLA